MKNTGYLETRAPVTGGAGFRLTQGTAPTTPNDGDLWVTSAGLFARINGTTKQLMSFADKAAATDIWTGTDDAKFVTSAAILAAAASVSVTYASTITLDMTAGWNRHTTLTGNLTLANPTNLAAGQHGRIRLTQDSTPRTLSLGSYWKVAGGAPTMSTASGAVDDLVFFVHSPTYIEAVYSKAFA